MGIYIFEFFMIIIINLLIKNKKIEFFSMDSDKLSLFLSFLMFTIVMAFREPHLGTDSWMYGNIFFKIGTASDFFKAMEVSTMNVPLYVLFCRIIYKISPTRQALLIFSSIVVNFLFFNFIKRESKDYLSSLLLYMTLAFHFQTFNTTRNFISIALVMNAFSYWTENRKDIKGWIFIFAGILIHSTSIIGLIYLIIIGSKKENEMKVLSKGIVISVVCALSQTIIISLFLRLFPQYNSYFGSSLGQSFNDNSNQGRQVILILLYLIIVIYAVVETMYKTNHEIKQKVLIQLSPMIIAVVVGVLGANSWALSRLNLYFTPIALCFIPNTFRLSNIRFKQVNNLLRILIICVTSVYGLYYLVEDKADIVPYYLFFMNT